jgi:hypothetical protein
MLRFDIKGFIDPCSIKRNNLTRVDFLVNGRMTPLTTKAEIEDQLLARNTRAYLASGTTPFGHTVLGRSLGPNSDSPLADSILDGSFLHPNHAVSAFTQQLCHHSHCPDIPTTRITEKQFSRAFGGLREKYVSSPSGLYNAHYMYLASRKSVSYSNPIRKIQAHLLELPIARGFASDCQLVCYDCPIYINPGGVRSEKLRLVHGVESTDNQALKSSVAWVIRRLVKQFDDIFYEFQFGHPHQTCLSAIILKELTIESFMLTKIPGIIIDSDATGDFNRVICGIALLALHIIGFATSVARMLGITWSKRECYIKTGFGVHESFYQ